MRPATDAHPLTQRQNQIPGLTRLSLGPPNKNAQLNPLTGRSLVQAVCLRLGTKALMTAGATVGSSCAAHATTQAAGVEGVKGPWGIAPTAAGWWPVLHGKRPLRLPAAEGLGCPSKGLY